MINNLLLLSTFGAIVSAATTSSPASSTSSSSSSTPSGGANPFIPPSLSQACQDALNTVNSDSSLQACTSDIASALSAFNPTNGGSSSDVNGAITKLCTSGTVSGCASDKIRSLLTTMEQGCSAELSASSPTPDEQLVAYQYDLLYTMPPMIGAFCSVDTATKKPCIMEIVSGTPPTPGGSSSDVTDGASNTTSVNNSTEKATGSTFTFKQSVNQKILTPTNLYINMDSSNEKEVMGEIFPSSGPQKRDDSSNSVNIPNTPLYASAALPFLFLTADMPASMLCTQCTQTMMMQYTAFQESHPYASGLANSILLGGESAFYQSLSATCGSGFVSSIAQAAGDNGAGRVGLGFGALVGLIGLAALI